MSEILTERSGSILRIQLNRPEKKNAMTSTCTSLSRSFSMRRRRDRFVVSSRTRMPTRWGFQTSVRA